jgi:hypothetical protein
VNTDPFNDASGLPRYRRTNEKLDALRPLGKGIKARHQKGYPDKAIAAEIKEKYPTDPILKDITARHIRQFRTQEDQGGSSPKKTVTPSPTSTQGGSALAK